MTPPLLSLANLSVRYGGFWALRNVSLELTPGSFTALIGPNGAGKSTLIGALTRIITPVEGEIRCGSRLLHRLSDRELARTIAVVPQEVWAPFDFTVLEVTLMGRSPHLGGLGLESAADVVLAREALARLGLTELESRPLPTLSGGERQRVMLARMLVQDTPVVVLDEPTAHLDLAHQQQALELMQSLHREGRTVLTVMHDLNLASLYCPHVILLRRGEIFAAGTPEAVLTEANLTEVYGARVLVLPHPETGRPVILPRASASS